MAQSGTCSFNMTKTYFCKGETIVFEVDCSLGNQHIVGPMNTPYQNTYLIGGSPVQITNCGPQHSGVYQLRAQYQGINNYVMDEIEIHVVDVDVNAWAVPPTVTPGGVTTLHASGADYYVWSPSDYLSDTIWPPADNDISAGGVQLSIPSDISEDVECLTYTVTGYTSGDNRVTNGDFEQSGSCATGYGFYSDYDCYSGANCLYPSWHEGGYSIHDNANYIHQDFYNPDNNHGKFMIINGDPTQNAPYRIIWSQSIRVRPNTQYAFSADVCTFVNRNYACLRFQINGTFIGDEEGYTAPHSSAGWQTFYALWEGSASDIATITIVNQQTAGDGNDFGIDNITFYDLMECADEESVVVCIERDVEVGDIQTPDPICAGDNLQMTVPTVTVNSGSSSYSGHWVVGPTPHGPWQQLSSLNNIPASYDGWYICYQVIHSGHYYYSNAVPISVIELEVTIEVEGGTVVGDDVMVCEDDTVTLHAHVDSVSLSYPAVGDILCQDGRIVKPANWTPDMIPKGIVFYVDNTYSHGWAVSLTQSGNIQWTSGTTALIGTGHPQWRDAIQDMNGYANTRAIRNSSLSTNPAAMWVDFNNGWYLPSAGQLNLLFGELMPVNLSLGLVGGTRIWDENGVGTGLSGTGNVHLWSSTQRNHANAYTLEILDGEIATKGKTSQNVVRAVIDF